MRVSSYITFIDKDGVSKKAFERIGKREAYDESDIFQAVELFKDLDDYSLFLKELDRRNIDYEERFRTVFSKEELLNAPYLYVTSSDYCCYPQPESSYREECFDFGAACPVCNNGAKQTENFKIIGTLPKAKYREIVNLNWEFEFLIKDRMAALFEKESFLGYKLRPLINYPSGEVISDWKQLVIENILPPMAKETVFPVVSQEYGSNNANEYGIKNPPLCTCGKMGKNLPNEIYYNETELDNFLDFNKTAEWLGGGYTTYQHKIISNRVYKLLIREKIKNLEFIPIMVL